MLEKLNDDPEGMLNGYYHFGVDFEGFPNAIYEALHGRIGELGPDLADAISVAYQALEPLRPKLAHIVTHWDPSDTNPSHHELPEGVNVLIQHALKSVIDAVGTLEKVWVDAN